MGLYLELREVNSNLAAWLAPALLGSAGAGYLTAASAAAAGGALVALKGGVTYALTPLKSLGPAGGTAAAGVATVAVIATVAVATTGDDPESTTVATPVATSTPAVTEPVPSPSATAPTAEPTQPEPEPTDSIPTTEPTVSPVEVSEPDTTAPRPPQKSPAAPKPTPTPTPEPTAPAPSPSVGDGLLDLEILGIHLGTLGGGQLISVGLTHSDQPAVVILRYDEPATLIGTVSPGWSCFQNGQQVRCVGEGSRTPLAVMVKSSGKPVVSLGY